jgi:hypothetical protein
VAVGRGVAVGVGVGTGVGAGVAVATAPVIVTAIESVSIPALQSAWSSDCAGHV